MIKHFALKFNHGVEIGAHLAYVGHYARTKDMYIRLIASEEVNHKEELEFILQELGEKPLPIIDESFRLVGNIIRYLCLISPKFLLNVVARLLETFAVFNYRKLAKQYPQYVNRFNDMADTEQEHEDYFKNGQLPKRLTNNTFLKRAHYYYGPQDDV